MAERRCSVSSLKAFDRFIPYRPNLDVDSSYVRLMSCSTPAPENDSSQFKTPVTKSYTRLLSDSTQAGHGSILPIRSTKETSPFAKRMGSLYAMSPDEGYHSPTPSAQRHIPTSPECIMDMPGLRDDFYTNLLDWSEKNLIAVALQKSTYIWNAESKDCQRIEIFFPSPSSFYISSLCWSPHDKVLAIADNSGDITICNVEKMKSHRKLVPAREMCSVGAVQWTEFGIISGNRNGDVTLYDVRSKKSLPITLAGVERSPREVCGLRLAPGTSWLASGSDDGVVKIWDLRMMRKCNTINAHTACVKAMAWCPWRQGVLATGGGTSDGHIRLWYAQSGENLGETFTNSQVCGLVWSEEYKEIVSALGSPTPESNDLILWDMKNCEFEPVDRLRQHMARPLHIALSPDKTTIASAGADESLCLWNVFPRKCKRRVWTPWDRSPLNTVRFVR